jgi:hypothetical protein
MSKARTLAGTVSDGAVLADGTVDAAEIGGTLPVANGGTGATTLTANNVLLGNGTSALQVVAPGTSGNVLTSNGTTWTSATPAGGGSMVHLSTVTASASATVDIETTFNSTYDAYVLMVVGVVLSVDGTDLLLRMKIGGTYLTTSTYSYHSSIPASSGASYNAFDSFGVTSILMVRPGNVGGEGTNFNLHVNNPSSTTLQKQVYWQGSSINAAGSVVNMSGGASNSGTAEMTGLRFFPGSGSITTGTFRLYGIKNS